MSFITESTWYLKRVAKNFNYRLTGHYQKKFPPGWPEWAIGIYAGPDPLNLGGEGAIVHTTGNVITHADITDVPAGFVADPFMLNVNGTWHMFFEILSLLDHKGKIGWATSSDGLHWDYQRLVIDEPFHLSYPYVFEWQGEYYMVPESWEANGIRLYRADRFPDRWTLWAISWRAFSLMCPCFGIKSAGIFLRKPIQSIASTPCVSTVPTS